METLDRRLGRFRCLSSNAVKLLAVLSMVVDHFSKIVLWCIVEQVWYPMALAGELSQEQFMQIQDFILHLCGIGTIAFPLSRRNRIYHVSLLLLLHAIALGSQYTVYLLLACLVILLYNGKRGNLRIKYSFYIFYPAHLALFHLVTLFLTPYAG